MKTVGVSLKTYFSRDASVEWLIEVARSYVHKDGVQLVVFPDVFLLSDARRILPEQVLVGAQGVDQFSLGPVTGARNAEIAFQCGARFAEIGHAERKSFFGESDVVFSGEIAAAEYAGLTPWVCVGELERVSPAEAAAQCVEQMNALGLPVGSVAAYEPVWAIGAAEPAPPQYVRDVVSRLREWSDSHERNLQFVYGGTAGPGTLNELGTAVDGVFLGRRAHDVRALFAVLDEAARDV